MYVRTSADTSRLVAMPAASATVIFGDEIAARATAFTGSRTRIERAAPLPICASRIFSCFFIFSICVRSGRCFFFTVSLSSTGSCSIARRTGT